MPGPIRSLQRLGPLPGGAVIWLLLLRVRFGWRSAADAVLHWLTFGPNPAACWAPACRLHLQDADLAKTRELLYLLREL